MSTVRPAIRSRWDFAINPARSLWQRLTPPQLFAGSFLLLILLGTLGLKTLPGLYTGRPLNWLEALFTATSAVCVTGLIVQDTATFFTPAGQAFLLLLIQLGGLGMLTFTSLILITLGQRLSLRQEAVTGAALDESGKTDPRRVVLNVILFTLAIEIAGAVILYLLWAPRLGWRGAAWHATFHSVSAFCNAGFSTFTDSLIPFREAPVSLMVIMTLVVAGGLGFLTLEECYLYVKARRKGKGYRVSLHSRLVLGTTAVLLMGGWLLYAVAEWGGVLSDMPPGHRVVNALFMSVTARTAGFNTVEYAGASEGTNFLTILLMMIGGSPGSTAGGLKTTTFALLGLLAWSRLRGYEVVSVSGRSLREETTDRATGLFVVGFGIVTVGILALAITDGGSAAGRFLDRMFEAVSAFNTVGLSTGQTTHLSLAGRGVLIALMFLGRVGTLTLAAALTRRVVVPDRFRYAYEEVMVG